MLFRVVWHGLAATKELPSAVAVLVANTNGISITAPYGRDWLDAAVDIDRHNGLISANTA